MSLIIRDWWKLFCFLLIWFVLQLVSRRFNPLDGVLLMVCFLILQGILPYMAKRAKLISLKHPLVLFLILEIVLIFLTRLSLPLWMFHVIPVLEATIFFLLIMAVSDHRRYSIKPLMTHWIKWLITVIVFYVTEMLLFPFLWNKFYSTGLDFLSQFLIPLLYIGITYGLISCKK